MKRYCLALDLKDDEQLVAEYEAYHRAVWPEILASIKNSGILSMEIYRYGNRLCMIVEATDDFSFARKNQMDAHNPKVQEWEQLMWQYQQALPGVPPGVKWVEMKPIFTITDTIYGNNGSRESEVLP